MGQGWIELRHHDPAVEIKGWKEAPRMASKRTPFAASKWPGQGTSHGQAVSRKGDQTSVFDGSSSSSNSGGKFRSK